MRLSALSGALADLVSRFNIEIRSTAGFRQRSLSLVSLGPRMTVFIVVIAAVAIAFLLFRRRGGSSSSSATIDEIPAIVSSLPH